MHTCPRESCKAALCDLCSGYGVPTVRSSAKYGVIKKSELRGMPFSTKPYDILSLWSTTSSLFASCIHWHFFLNKCKWQPAAEITHGSKGVSKRLIAEGKDRQTWIYPLPPPTPWVRKNWLSFSWDLGCSKCLRSTGNLRSQHSHTKNESWRSLGDSEWDSCAILPNSCPVLSIVRRERKEVAGLSEAVKQILWRCHATSAGKVRGTSWMHRPGEAPRLTVDLAPVLLRLPLEGYQWKLLICFHTALHYNLVLLLLNLNQKACRIPKHISYSHIIFPWPALYICLKVLMLSLSCCKCFMEK